LASPSISPLYQFPEHTYAHAAQSCTANKKIWENLGANSYALQ
jgi:hypothetical protein